MSRPSFYTDYQYTDRKTKARYVWLKYQSILRGQSILDVGADECHLKQYLDEGSSYCGIGLGEHVERHVNLEREKVPFPDNSFDCVLCLDVLEHLDNIHEIFDELCRVTRRHVIISLPNPWGNFYGVLCFGDYRPDQAIKFYGLPLESPQDRHKWFFSTEEAEKFILYRAAKNGMQVAQMDCRVGGEARGWKYLARILARTILLRGDLNLKNLYAGTLWAVLEKGNSGK
ncbi:MAG: methyltransferase domain-containing protein [Thermoflexales bacterium]|nr:methyltransferase domain-containing protein [Thermoflexales bacterium]